MVPSSIPPARDDDNDDDDNDADDDDDDANVAAAASSVAFVVASHSYPPPRSTPPSIVGAWKSSSLANVVLALIVSTSVVACDVWMGGLRMGGRAHNATVVIDADAAVREAGSMGTTPREAGSLRGGGGGG